MAGWGWEMLQALCRWKDPHRILLYPPKVADHRRPASNKVARCAYPSLAEEPGSLPARPSYSRKAQAQHLGAPLTLLLAQSPTALRACSLADFHRDIYMEPALGRKRVGRLGAVRKRQESRPLAGRW